MYLKDNRKNLFAYPLWSGILITVIFSVILSLNNIFDVWTSCVNAGFSDIWVYLIDFSFRFLSGALVVRLIVLFLFYISKEDISFKNYFIDNVRVTRGVSLNISIIIGIISSLIYFLLCVIVASALGAFKLDFDVIFKNPSITTGVGWFIFLYAIIPGVWEEITFRGVILNSLKTKYSENLSIVVSSILFGIFHIITSIIVNEPGSMIIFYFIMSTLFGLTWGYMVVKCESVLSSILAHYIIDAFGYAFITNPLSSSQSIAGPFFMLTTFLYPLISFLLVKGYFDWR